MRFSASSTSVSKACWLTRMDCSCCISKKSTATSSNSCDPSLASIGPTGSGWASVRFAMLSRNSARFALSRVFISFSSIVITYLTFYCSSHYTFILRKLATVDCQNSIDGRGLVSMATARVAHRRSLPVQGDRDGPTSHVILSAAKDLCAQRVRPFAALRVTLCDGSNGQGLFFTFEPCLSSYISSKSVFCFFAFIFICTRRRHI